MCNPPVTNLVFHYQVQIDFPNPSKKSDVVSLTGLKADVDKAFKHLTKMHQDMVSIWDVLRRIRYSVFKCCYCAKLYYWVRIQNT